MGNQTKFHVYRSRNVGTQPSKPSKFGILPIKLPLRGDSSGHFFEILSIYARLQVTSYVFNYVAFRGQTTKL